MQGLGYASLLAESGMYVALHVHLASGTCSVTLFSEALARELKAAAPETFPSRLLARRGLACRCEPRPAGGHGKGICNVKEGAVINWGNADYGGAVGFLTFEA